MRKLIAFVLTLTMVLSLCVLSRAEFYAEVYNTDSLNIRSGPASTYQLLGSVSRGGLVRVLGESGNWYQVVTVDSNVYGYMSKNFLRSVSAPVTESGNYAVVYNTAYLNLRSGPGAEYTWLGSVLSGEWVEILGESGNWYQVRVVNPTNGVANGYMSKNYLSTGSQSTGTGTEAVVTNPSGTSFLNLREQPSLTANVLGIFYNGETCRILNNCGNGWYYVSAWKNGIQLYGYFRSEFLTVKSSGTSAGTCTVSTGNSGWLNLRSEPSYTCTVLAQLYNGMTLNILAKGNSFWMVESNGVKGFVDCKYVSTKSSGGSGSVVTGTAVVQTGNSGKLNLRDEAYASATVLGSFSNGTQVSVLEKGSAWTYVSAGGMNGYMMTKYLSFNTSISTERTVQNPNGGTYVNLRSTPGKTSGNISIRVAVGANVTLLAWGEEWSQVAYGSYNGYMMSAFLKK